MINLDLIFGFRKQIIEGKIVDRCPLMICDVVNYVFDIF